MSKNIKELEIELQEWKQIAADALSGNEMLVFDAYIKANFDEVLEDLQAVKQVLMLCEGKPCIETMEDIIKRVKKGLRK